VLRSAAAPDDERVALEQRLRGDFADQRAALHAPVLGIALPAVERLAIEDRFEAGLVSGQWFRPVALFRDVLLGRQRHSDHRSQETSSVRGNHGAASIYG